MNDLTGGKSHFHVCVKAKHGGFGSKAERDAERERRKEAQKAVRLAGFEPSRYFQYKNGDTGRKVQQKENAEHYAKKVQDATGVEMEVCEGFFLNLW